MEEVLDGCKKKVNEVLKKKFRTELNGNNITFYLDNNVTFHVDIKDCHIFSSLSSVMEEEEFKRIYKFYYNLDSYKI